MDTKTAIVRRPAIKQEVPQPSTGTGIMHPIAILRRSLQKPGTWIKFYGSNRFRAGKVETVGYSNRQTRRHQAALERYAVATRRRTWNRIAARAQLQSGK